MSPAEAQAVLCQEIAALRTINAISAKRIEDAVAALVRGQASFSFDQQEHAHQKSKVLEMLKAARSVGVTNTELNRQAGFRYGARIWELRDEGYTITSVREQGGLWRFTLAPQDWGK